VAQGVSLEFKPQYGRKKKKKEPWALGLVYFGSNPSPTMTLDKSPCSKPISGKMGINKIGIIMMPLCGIGKIKRD
jgi:hypothetical protein